MQVLKIVLFQDTALPKKSLFAVFSPCFFAACKMLTETYNFKEA